MSERRRRSAYHEAGHAVAAHFHRESGLTRAVTLAAVDLANANEGLHRVNKARGLHIHRRPIFAPVSRGGSVVDRPQLEAELLVVLAGPAAGFLLAGEERQRSARVQRRQELELLEHSDGTGDHERAYRIVHDLNALDVSQLRAIPESGREAAAREWHALVADAFEQARREALAFVASTWPHVQAVAERLLRRGRLDGHELREAIEEIEERLREGPTPLL